MSGDCPHCGRFQPRSLKTHIKRRCEESPEAQE